MASIFQFVTSPARMRAEANYFIYSMRDFIYLAPTGENGG
jgi:hypothetical protein